MHHDQNATLNDIINACEDNAKSSLHHYKANMSLWVLKIGYNDFPVSSNKVTIALNHKTTKLFSQLLLCFHIVNCYIDRCCCVRARRSQVRNMKIKLPVNRNEFFSHYIQQNYFENYLYNISYHNEKNIY